jgi:general secretion pathway protein A
MYTQFYGLREKPFGLGPDPRYLFLADSHREALAHLLYGIEQGEGFIAVTGEVGTGKTTVCRALLQRIEPGTEVAFIFNPQLSATELLQEIASELGLDAEGKTRREIHESLNNFLLAKKSEGRKVLLLIDEAQNLAPETLEQVRLLSNLETETSKLIQIILIGQPELDAMLESPSLRQLRQRITVRWRLTPLSASETRDYVRHRLRTAAGGPRDIFSELALREIHRRSGGIPRVVNLLCDRALLAGYAAGASTIGLGLVTQTDRELRGPTPSAARKTGGVFLRWAFPVVALAVLGVAAGFGVNRWLLPEVQQGPEAPLAAAAPAQAPAQEGEPTTAAIAQRSAGPAEREAGLDPFAPLPPARLITPELPSFSEVPAGRLPAVGAPPPSQGTVAASVEPPAPLDFADALADRAPGRTMLDAINGVLAAWGEAPSSANRLSLNQAQSELRQRGLFPLVLSQSTRRTLEVLNLPAVIELEADDGALRNVALAGFDGPVATLFGLDGSEGREVAWSSVARRWNGRAMVVWRDFEQLPGVLTRGSTGTPVTWLQQSLSGLGFYRGENHGRYDTATANAVRNFQQSHELRVDGAVGPVTKMALYSVLTVYPAPRLRSEGGLE